MVGEDRKYVAVNDTACKLLGYERDELLALGPADLAPDLDLDERFEELGRTGKLAGTARLRTKHGEIVEFAYRTSETTAARMRFWISVGFPQ